MFRLLASFTPKSSRLARFESNSDRLLMQGINRATILISNEIKKELSKGGRVARRAKGPRGGRVIPLNTGVHLRVQSGDLRSSWRTRPARRAGRYIEGHVASRVVYSAIHEYGGWAGPGHSVFIRPRPYVAPALKTAAPHIVDFAVTPIINWLERGQ